VISCAAFICVPIFLTHEETGLDFTSPGNLRDIVGYILIIGYFYVNFYYLIPKFYLKRQYVAFALLTVFSFLVITGIPIIFFPLKTLQELFRTSGRPLWLGDLMHYFFPFIAVFLISLMLRIRDQWKRAREDKTIAELAFLKSQIQPHFLYNTLNTIYALSIEGSPETPDAIARLSAMMRYVTDEAALDYVPLARELDYIESYITLQELRFGRTVGISSIVSGKAGDHKIAPMMLIPFIENAFKHGINPEEESGIVVRINIDEDVLRLNVRNRLVHVQREDERGLGLANTRSRLKLLYPGRYELYSSAKDGLYTINLTLNLV
jgi:hypothetical protein